MSADRYARSGERRALGAELVDLPVAELVASSAHPLTGRTVMGAGAGAASAALCRRGARTLAVDLPAAMLAWRAASRPPSTVPGWPDRVDAAARERHERPT